MSLNISDMVFIPQGVYLFRDNQSITISVAPNYGIIIDEKSNSTPYKNMLPVVIGDIKYYINEEDLYPCS